MTGNGHWVWKRTEVFGYERKKNEVSEHACG